MLTQLTARCYTNSFHPSSEQITPALGFLLSLVVIILGTIISIGISASHFENLHTIGALPSGIPFSLRDVEASWELQLPASSVFEPLKRRGQVDENSRLRELTSTTPSTAAAF